MHETSTLLVLFIAHEIVIFDPEATAGHCTVALAKRVRLNSTKKCSSWIVTMVSYKAVPVTLTTFR